VSQELTIFHDVAKALNPAHLDSILQPSWKNGGVLPPDTVVADVDEEKTAYFAIAVGAAAEVLSKERLKVGKESPVGGAARQLLIVPCGGRCAFSSRLDEITQVKTRR